MSVRVLREVEVDIVCVSQPIADNHGPLISPEMYRQIVLPGYRRMRKQFGRHLRLIGGIDLDTLNRDESAIDREIHEKVPPLLAQGGYIPLADGRVRANVPWRNYVHYRRTLEEVVRTDHA